MNSDRLRALLKRVGFRDDVVERVVSDSERFGDHYSFLQLAERFVVSLVYDRSISMYENFLAFGIKESSAERWTQLMNEGIEPEPIGLLERALLWYQCDV